MFYIIEVNDQPLYNLRRTSTHETIACGSDIFTLIGTVSHYMRKYKEEGNIDKVLDSMARQKINTITYKQRQAEYNSKPHLFDDEIQSIIRRYSKPPIPRPSAPAPRPVKPSLKRPTLRPRI